MEPERTARRRRGAERQGAKATRSGGDPGGGGITKNGDERSKTGEGDSGRQGSDSPPQPTKIIDRLPYLDTIGIAGIYHNYKKIP